MNRDSGAENPGQRTVADLLKEYGGDSGDSQRGDRRRRRRAEDTTETAPHAIIDRVLSDSGQLRAIRPDEEPPPELRSRSGSPPADSSGADSPSAGSPSAGSQDAPATPPAAPQPSPAPNPQPAVQPPAEPMQQSPQSSPAPQQPAQQQPAQQQTSAQGSGEDFANAPVGPEGANFWAQRFAAAGVPPAQAAPGAQPSAGGDAEPTVQQQPLSPRPQPYPRSGPRGAADPAASADAAASSAPAGEDATEKLPMVSAQERAGGGTAMFAFPGSGQDAAAELGDPYDFDDDVGDFGDDADGYGPDEDGGVDDGDFAFDDEEADDRPTGLPADDGTDEGERSPGRQWVGQVAQAAVGLLCGAVVFFGFSWLWAKNSVAAFVAALVVTGCLVLLARKLRGDDLQIILLAVLAGLFCTVSPAALLMLGQ